MQRDCVSPLRQLVVLALSMGWVGVRDVVDEKRVVRRIWEGEEGKLSRYGTREDQGR